MMRMWYMRVLMVAIMLVALTATVTASILVFSQDYTDLDSLPSNVALLISGEPTTAVPNATLGYGSGGLTEQAEYGNRGSMIIAGPTPSTTTTFNIVFDTNSTSTTSEGIIYIGNMYIVVKQSSEIQTVIYQYYNDSDTFDFEVTSRQHPMTLSLDFDGPGRTYTSNINGHSMTTPLYEGAAALPNTPISGSYIEFKPDMAAAEENFTFIVYSANQTVPKNAGNITAIGDQSLTSFGIDGPNGGLDQWQNGAELIRSVNGTATVWADVGDILTEGTTEYIQELIDDGWELGVHYSEHFSELSYEEAEDYMDNETASLTDTFGQSPTSFCALGNTDNITHWIYAYTNLNQITRNGPSGISGGGLMRSLITEKFNWSIGMANIGGSTRLFTHKTDNEPPLSENDIGYTNFSEWVTSTAAHGLKISSYIGWYKVNANTEDATFTENVDPSHLLNFTAHTNGYPALVEVDLPYDAGNFVYNITGGLTEINFTESTDGNTKFYVDNESTYIILEDEILTPASNFTGTPTYGYVSLSVQFNDTSENTPTSWNWSFGDGSYSNVQNATHAYTHSGLYNVSLNASNLAGSDTETKTNYINVSVMPNVIFSGTPLSGATPLTVSFTDASTTAEGTIDTWDWMFGDGSPNSTTQNPTHAYTTFLYKRHNQTLMFYLASIIDKYNWIAPTQ